MSTYFRSEPMAYCQALMPRQSAWTIMNKLGELDILHIIKNPHSYDSPFNANLKRCDQTLTRIEHIKSFLSQFPHESRLIKYRNPEQMFQDFQQALIDSKIPGSMYMNEIEDQIYKLSKFFNQQKHDYERIKERRNELIQNTALSLSVHDIVKIRGVFDQNSFHNDSFDFRRKVNKLEYKIGLIRREDQMILEKLVFRVSKGNAWIEILEVKTHEMRKIFEHEEEYEFVKGKIIFCILYQSGEHSILDYKMNKLLSSLDCFMKSDKEIEDNKNKSLQTLREEFVKSEIEINNLFKITEDNIKHYITELYSPKKTHTESYLQFLHSYTIKQKTLYQSLIQCTPINNFLSFKCYIPKSKLSQLQKLKSNQSILNFLINIKQYQEVPPSKFLTCEILEIPQEIVNTYGIPLYQEFNPAPLYIITFGLFIGVMFGDVGHMLIAMILLILIKPNKWWWTVVFWMGFCGAIYNEFFGINLGWFESCYRIIHPYSGHVFVTVIEKTHHDCVYPFGIDPIWKVSGNQMAFTNSFKMKLSVIFGVLHMSVGIILKGVNSIRKKNYLDLFTLVIPQLLFMFSTFIYMDILIILKWLTKYNDPSTAPSIINTLIGMFISNKHTNQYFMNQAVFQQFLMVLSIILIPFLLFAKPFVIWITGSLQSGKLPVNVMSDERFQNADPGNHLNLQQDMEKQIQLTGSQEFQNLPSEIINHSKQQIHDFKELMIHQLIETIEFVLGAISNTASYLRLWALSLAHSQLAEVFFTLLLEDSLEKEELSVGRVVKLGVVFVFFISVTFGVLVCMDVMECFLHSLRLHWVEFQNKFFSGTGYLFEAYSFRKEIKKRENK